MASNRSGAAVGFTMFAAFMMILIGSFHIIAGLAGILEDEFYAVTPNWVLQFDATTWGWIHLLAGIIVLLAGFGLFSGAVWARTVGVIMATVSAIANFAWIPHYPFWALTIIAIDIFDLGAHGARARHRRAVERSARTIGPASSIGAGPSRVRDRQTSCDSRAASRS